MYIATISTLLPKVDVCIHMTMVRTNDANGIIDDIYQCLVHSRLFRVDYSVIDSHLHDVVTNVTIAKANKDKQQTLIAKQSVLWRQNLKKIQTEMVLVIMRLRHYSQSLTIPKFTNMNTVRVLKTVDHFATELSTTTGYISELPNQLKPHIFNVGNMTLHLSELDRLAKCEDAALLALEGAFISLKTRILALYG